MVSFHPPAPNAYAPRFGKLSQRQEVLEGKELCRKISAQSPDEFAQSLQKLPTAEILAQLDDYALKLSYLDESGDRSLIDERMRQMEGAVKQNLVKMYKYNRFHAVHVSDLHPGCIQGLSNRIAELRENAQKIDALLPDIRKKEHYTLSDDLYNAIKQAQQGIETSIKQAEADYEKAFRLRQFARLSCL